MDISLKGMRKMIADKMYKSLQETAQLSYHIDVDAGELIAAREHFKNQGQRVGYEDLLIIALCKALKKHPQFNALIDGNTSVAQEDVHVSVAVALDNGLVAPTIFDANRKSPAELCETRTELVERARINKLTVAELTKGTFTLSNLGISRVRYFTPIINSPQLAIIGIGQIDRQPRVDKADNIVIRPIMGLSLTTDHRFIDGGPAGDFMTDLANIIEDEQTFACYLS